MLFLKLIIMSESLSELENIPKFGISESNSISAKDWVKYVVATNSSVVIHVFSCLSNIYSNFSLVVYDQTIILVLSN